MNPKPSHRKAGFRPFVKLRGSQLFISRVNLKTAKEAALFSPVRSQGVTVIFRFNRGSQMICAALLV